MNNKFKKDQNLYELEDILFHNRITNIRLDEIEEKAYQNIDKNMGEAALKALNIAMKKYHKKNKD